MNDKIDSDFEDDAFYDDALDSNFDFDESDYIEEEILDDPMSDDFDFDADFDADIEESFDDEEGEEGFDDFSSGKKKSKFGLSFNTLVIAGAVLVGGLVMVGQMNKTGKESYGSKAKMERFATALKMEGAFSGPGKIKEEDLNPVKSSGNEKNKKKKTGFLFDAEELGPDEVVIEKDNLLKGAPPMPSPIISDEGNVILSGNKKNIEDLVPRAPLPDEAAAITTLDNVFGAKPNKEISDVQTDLNNKVVEAIDRIEDKLPKVEALLGVEQVQIIDTTPMQVAKQEGLQTPQEAKLLLTKLETITKRLDDMETKIVSLKEHQDNTPIVLEMDNIIESEPIPEAQVQIVSQEIVSLKKSIKKKPVKKTTAKSKVKWELRAAQPGKAWVSKSGQRDMRPVVVGDQLASIGRVESIRYQGKKWTVQGQFGKIVQK